MISYDERKQLFDIIKLLVKSEYDEVFRIIHKMKVKYTENSNGVFFDLQTVSDETYFEINEYIKYCLKTRQEHEERLKELELIKEQNKHYIDTD